MVIKTQWSNNNIFLISPRIKKKKKIPWNNSFMGKIHVSQGRRTNINYTTQIINVHYGILSNLHTRREKKNKQVRYCRHLNPSPSSWKRQLKQLLCQSWQTKTNMGIWQTDEGDKRREEEKETVRMKRSLVGNLLFVLQTQRNSCDYSIDWIICKVRPPIFSPSYSSAPLPLSSQVVHMAAKTYSQTYWSIQLLAAFADT